MLQGLWFKHELGHMSKLNKFQSTSRDQKYNENTTLKEDVP